MPERAFASETWDSDEWFQELNRDQRYLFIYLWTNNHCNQAGLYHITLTTIANETLFSKEELPELLYSLEAKVSWYPEDNIIWVKNFLKWQFKSPKFLAAAGKCLTTIKNNGAVHELLEYYKNRYSILIPYQYYMDKLSILTRATDTDTDTKADTERVGEGRNIISVPNTKQHEPESEIYTQIFETWNSLGLIKHKKLTGDMKQAIKAASRDFTAAEISQAMKNYVRIVNDDSCYFKYRWTLKDFLKRGLEKFLELEVALNNYRRRDTSGADKRYSGAGQKRSTVEEARASLHKTK
jgi:hypothetical protein